MQTLKKTQLGAEKKYLKKLYRKYGRVTQPLQKKLEERGYELVNLGTTKRCFTRGGEVGYKQCTSSNAAYYGIGFHNISRGGYPVYRAFVKRVEK